jgi:hypothetical protein
MNDFRTMFSSNSRFLKAGDLRGRDVTVTIRDIQQGKIDDDEKPVFYFEDFQKGLFCNVENSNTIVALYGCDPDRLIGQRITLFPTRCQNSKQQTVPCIRVRPQRPSSPSNGNGARSRHGAYQRNASAPQADQEFTQELHRALAARGFTESAEFAFVDWACVHATVEEIYNLNPAGRIELLEKIARGRFDRFKNTALEVASSTGSPRACTLNRRRPSS